MSNKKEEKLPKNFSQGIESNGMSVLNICCIGRKKEKRRTNKFESISLLFQCNIIIRITTKAKENPPAIFFFLRFVLIK